MAMELYLAHVQHCSERPTNGFDVIFLQGLQLVDLTAALGLQIAAVVDSYQGQDPFNGDGYMAKGK